jgi:hypothetical protein
MSATGQPETAAPAPETGAETTTPQTTTPETTSQPGGYDKVMERMDALSRDQRATIERLEALANPPAEEDPEFDPSDFYDDDGQMTDVGAEAYLDDLVEKRLEARLAPREKAELLRQRDETYEAFVDEHPEMQDEKVSRPVLDRAVAWAHEHDAESLIDKPGFVDVIEWAFKAERWDSYQAQQQADQPRSVVLESASGAARETGKPQVDWGDRIVKAAERLKPQI